MAEPRTTPAQRQLLQEVREAGRLYIKWNSPAGRTAQALHRKGLLVIDEPDYSRERRDGYVIAGGEVTDEH